jgi:hypothetical protein
LRTAICASADTLMPPATNASSAKRVPGTLRHAKFINWLIMRNYLDSKDGGLLCPRWQLPQVTGTA